MFIIIILIVLIWIEIQLPINFVATFNSRYFRLRYANMIHYWMKSEQTPSISGFDYYNPL